MSMAVHYKSQRLDWETPPDLFAPLDKEFGFEVDVCATAENAKCVRYFSPEDDGLAQTWAPAVCWMNPPYGHEIRHWLRKAYEESLRGATVVCLVPARTDTSYWHAYAMKAAEIRYLRGRVRFVGAPHPAPFPSALVIFRPKNQRERQAAADARSRRAAEEKPALHVVQEDEVPPSTEAAS